MKKEVKNLKRSGLKGQTVLECTLLWVVLILAVIAVSFIPHKGEFSIKPGFLAHFQNCTNKILGN